MTKTEFITKYGSPDNWQHCAEFTNDLNSIVEMLEIYKIVSPGGHRSNRIYQSTKEYEKWAIYFKTRRHYRLRNNGKWIQIWPEVKK